MAFIVKGVAAAVASAGVLFFGFALDLPHDAYGFDLLALVERAWQ